MTQRFSKSRALTALDIRSARIASAEKFDRGGGTAQLRTYRFGDPKEDEVIRRAVEYGRMRAFEEFAEAIEENFSFDSCLYEEQE